MDLFWADKAIWQATDHMERVDLREGDERTCIDDNFSCHSAKT